MYFYFEFIYSLSSHPIGIPYSICPRLFQEKGIQFDLAPDDE